VGKGNHPEDFIARRQCRGGKRKELKERLRHERAIVMRRRMMGSQDRPTIPDEGVLRKMRSESLEKNMLRVFDKIDASSGSLFATGCNYTVHINRNTVLSKWKQSGSRVLHIDSTGSVCRKPQGTVFSTFFILKCL
jgi:hypothetical protein